MNEHSESFVLDMKRLVSQVFTSEDDAQEAIRRVADKYDVGAAVIDDALPSWRFSQMPTGGS